MVIGSTVYYLDGNPYFSPEFPRGGLAARFAVDVTHIVLGGAVQFDITIEHRNSEDTTWGSPGTFSGITGVGPVSLDVTGLKEIIRIKFSFSGGAPAASDAVHFLVQAPSWRPY